MHSVAQLKALPVNPGMAFVVVQHLDPHHESILHKLLSKATEMPVIQAEDGMALEPDHVYVIPPNNDIAVRERPLRLLSRRQSDGRHLPINHFFVSLAEDQKSAAIGVILSGTASDGTAGLQAIKSGGGVAFAQDPKSAGYPGMPEVGNMALPQKLLREGVRDMVRISDARMSGTAYGTVILHVAPESDAGGPLALVKTGDEIVLDGPNRSLELLVPGPELEHRRRNWEREREPSRYTRGWYKLYIDTVMQADKGADLDFLVGKSSPDVTRESH